MSKQKKKKTRAQEIQETYAQRCQILGDFLIKQILFNPGIVEAMKEVKQLSEELDSLEGDKHER